MDTDTKNHGPDLVKDTQDLANHAKDIYEGLVRTDQLQKVYQDNPYLILGAALGAGYLIGGGFPTPFTRRIIKIGMKALFVPLAAAQLKSLAIGSIPTDD